MKEIDITALLALDATRKLDLIGVLEDSMSKLDQAVASSPEGESELNQVIETNAVWETGISKLLTLEPAQKVDLIGQLWDSIDDTEKSMLLPVTDELMAELDRRHAEFLKGPSQGVPWREVMARLNHRYDDRAAPIPCTLHK